MITVDHLDKKVYKNKIYTYKGVGLLILYFTAIVVKMTKTWNMELHSCFFLVRFLTKSQRLYEVEKTFLIDLKSPKKFLKQSGT